MDSQQLRAIRYYRLHSSSWRGKKRSCVVAVLLYKLQVTQLSVVSVALVIRRCNTTMENLCIIMVSYCEAQSIT